MLVFFFVYVISFFFVMGGGDWFVVWLGMEVNMMSFIGMVIVSSNKVSVEGMYKYFFIQSLSSIVFLVMMYSGGFGELILMVKVGVGPFYFWFPSVVSSVGWWGGFFLMSFQSVIPLLVMSMMISWMVKLGGVMSMIVGGFGLLGQKDLLSLMAFSSINHLGWMMVGMVMGGLVWLYYFFVYIVVMYFLIYCLSKWELGFLGGVGISSGVVFIFLFLSMGGMPPMLGFLGKWYVFLSVVKVDVMVSVLMVIMSLLVIYVYMRVVYESFMGGGESLGVVGVNMEEVTLWVVFMVVGSLMFPFFFEVFV